MQRLWLRLGRGQAWVLLRAIWSVCVCVGLGGSDLRVCACGAGQGLVAEVWLPTHLEPCCVCTARCPGGWSPEAPQTAWGLRGSRQQCEGEASLGGGEGTVFWALRLRRGPFLGLPRWLAQDGQAGWHGPPGPHGPCHCGWVCWKPWRVRWTRRTGQW